MVCACVCVAGGGKRESVRKALLNRHIPYKVFGGSPRLSQIVYTHSHAPHITATNISRHRLQFHLNHELFSALRSAQHFTACYVIYCGYKHVQLICVDHIKVLLPRLLPQIVPGMSERVYAAVMFSYIMYIVDYG